MATFVQLASDTFHRPNEEPLNPINWTVNAASLGDLAVVSNLCEGPPVAEFGNEIYTGTSLPNDQYAKIILGNFSTVDTSDEISLWIRTKLDLTTGYFLDLTPDPGNPGGGFLELYSAGPNQLASVSIPIISKGDILVVAAIGTSILGFYNGSNLISVVDATTPSGSSGLSMGFTTAQSNVGVSFFGTGAAYNTAPYSVPDCRNYATFPNNARILNSTFIYDVDAQPCSVAPVDSRILKPKASGVYPQNSRTPGTFGPGE